MSFKFRDRATPPLAVCVSLFTDFESKDYFRRYLNFTSTLNMYYFS